MKHKIILTLSLVVALLIPSIVGARQLTPADISMPDGHKIEVVVQELDAPTMVAFDDQDRMLIAESAYHTPGGTPKITRIEKDGKRTILAEGKVFGDELPVTSVAFHAGQVYVVHAGTVSVVKEGGQLENIITGLPGQGDHQANQMVFKDGKMYFTIGTVTNSAVVGPDNAVFGWLEKEKLKDLHEVPCKNVVLSENATFKSGNVAGTNLPEARTSAYSPFGTEVPAGTTIPGNVKCNGALLRANPDGSNLEVVAWGLRNPYGLEIGPDNNFYVTMHGFDARGSRPIENAWDCFYKIEEGAWYGWPDFACDVPVTDPQFKPKDKPQPQFLISNHPTESPPKPITKFAAHAASNGFAFAPNSDWGKSTDAYIALFGDLTPATGTVSEPKGFKIVKVDTTNGKTEDFIKNKVDGKSSQHSIGGFEHPSDVTFGPDNAMYITDWGIPNITVEGLKLEKDSGVIWKVTQAASAQNVPFSPSRVVAGIVTLALAALAVFLAWGGARRAGWLSGLTSGLIAGLGMGVLTMLIAAFALGLPWWAPPRVLATMMMGPEALANILEFKLASFLVGLIVLMALTAALGVIFSLILRTTSMFRGILAGVFFGLASWALMQYFLLPVAAPLVADKGFPPEWFALSFAVYGLGLSLLLSRVSKPLP